ncbi:MAG TPA: Crp/Fnr family transcriptional regulator [Bacteroidales bacterium]|nr:Crp/Fnr family transcriptional regulator [Bacteroidales bacterium]
MKVSTKVSCIECRNKCDIYESVKMSGRSFSDANAIQVRFRRHERICRQGDAVSHAIYLVEGSAKLFIEGINNHNIILYLMKPPSYIGLLSFFESVTYTYSVTALEDSMACMVDLDYLKKLYIENHEVLLKLNKAFGKSVAMIMNKIICLNQKNTRGRIAESLLNLASFYGGSKYRLTVTRKELGEMSAISEENTVRLLTEMRKEGIISIDGRQVSLNNKNILKKISDLG